VTARRTLREWLETISRTAKGLRRAEYSMPRSRSDVTLVSVGRLWAERVVPLKQLFIDSGMPQDFIEKLNAAIENVQRTIQNQTQSNSARLEDAIAIQHTRGQAVAALRRLDPIMHNCCATIHRFSPSGNVHGGWSARTVRDLRKRKLRHLLGQT